jgi:hypothetical protein
MCQQTTSCVQPLTKKMLHDDLARHRGEFRSGGVEGMIDLTSDPRFSDCKLLFHEDDQERMHELF